MEQQHYLHELHQRNAKIVRVLYPRAANNEKELTVFRCGLIIFSLGRFDFNLISTYLISICQPEAKYWKSSTIRANGGKRSIRKDKLLMCRTRSSRSWTTTNWPLLQPPIRTHPGLARPILEIGFEWSGRGKKANLGTFECSSDLVLNVKRKKETNENHIQIKSHLLHVKVNNFINSFLFQ